MPRNRRPSQDPSLPAGVDRFLGHIRKAGKGFREILRLRLVREEFQRAKRDKDGKIIRDERGSPILETKKMYVLGKKPPS